MAEGRATLTRSRCRRAVSCGLPSADSISLLGGFDRMKRANLQELTSGVLDVLVVGGGIVGCGIARDAALRGLRVGLIEREDFGAGTTSRSTRLIHGGLRYLELLDFGLVRQDMREREILIRIAPH